MSNKKKQLKEIAKELKLSPATVSLVLHNKPGVSIDTRNIVTNSLEKYGYQKPRLEQNMKIIYLLKYSVLAYNTGLSNSDINSVLDAIALEARAQNYEIKIITAHEGEFIKTLKMLSNNPHDGMIVLGSDLPLSYSSDFEDYPSPVVLVDTYMRNCNLDGIVINNSNCISTAVNYLMSHGHINIGYIYSCYATFNYLERYNCFIDEMKKEGKLNKEWTYAINPMIERSYDNTVTVMMHEKEIPTAIIADSATIAIGMMNALRKRGVQIPNDISLVGIGDDFFCKIASPPISVIQMPTDYIGRVAMRRIEERINYPNNPVSLLSLCGKLIRRDSVLTIESRE